MALFRNLGPFSTTAIGHGEMPLTIENNRGHEVGIETLLLLRRRRTDR